MLLLLFILLALIVGVVSGAAIGYETRDLRNQPTGWRPWLLFVGVAAVVAACAALVERINETAPPSGPTKTLSLLAGAVAFAVALYYSRRRR
jgi:uncharacterized membrane protein YhiD involved in acid resistance